MERPHAPSPLPEFSHTCRPQSSACQLRCIYSQRLVLGSFIQPTLKSLDMARLHCYIGVYIFIGSGTLSPSKNIFSPPAIHQNLAPFAPFLALFLSLLAYILPF
jgi:hypothetical protein